MLTFVTLTCSSQQVTNSLWLKTYFIYSTYTNFYIKKIYLFFSNITKINNEIISKDFLYTL